jgi:hypothetical protein
MVDFFNTPYQETKLTDILSVNSYQTAEPYPHIVIDDLFNPEILNEIINNWTPLDDPTMEFHNDGTFVRNKKGTGLGTNFTPQVELFLWQLSRPRFLKFLEELTGINALIPDPYFYGGGLHSISSGGKLAIHADYNKHFKFNLDRRLNLLIYLNKDWTEENGGCLELWNNTMSECVKKVLPVFNRTVIFSTTSTSFHGHPEPVVCSSDNLRKSIALYYFSNGRPEEEIISPEEHTTLWQARPLEGF